MYIRRTQTRSTATGETYFTYRLVRSERQGAKVRAVTLLNLGRHFAVAQAHWPALCARIEELLCGQEALLSRDLPQSVERAAQRYAGLLLARWGERPAVTATDSPVVPDLQSVDVASLELIRPRSVAVEWVALWAMQTVGLIELLIGLGLSGPLRSVILGTMIGRMAQPGSERATRFWLEGSRLKRPFAIGTAQWPRGIAGGGFRGNGGECPVSSLRCLDETPRGDRGRLIPEGH
jgi:hypothetical protein